MECPKYQSCNAPLCPLDKHRNLRVRLTGEDTCPYNKSEINEIKKMAKVSDNFKRRPNKQMA